MYHSQKDYSPETEGVGLCIDYKEQMQLSFINDAQALGGKLPCINNVAWVVIFLHT